MEDIEGAIVTHRLEPYPSMRIWSADLYDREQLFKDESTLNNEQRKREDKDRGDMIKQEDILIKLSGESNFLFWMDRLSRIGDYLPKNTSQFKLTVFVKGSIANTEDKRNTEGMHTMDAINNYMRQRYMTSHDNIEATIAMASLLVETSIFTTRCF